MTDVAGEVGPSSSVVGASVASPSTSGADLGAEVEETGTAWLVLVRVSPRRARLLLTLLAWSERLLADTSYSQGHLNTSSLYVLERLTPEKDLDHTLVKYEMHCTADLAS